MTERERDQIKRRIARILRTKPDVTTHHLARQAGCSWDFAQKARHELGKNPTVRVRTDGRAYTARGDCPMGSGANLRRLTNEGREDLAAAVSAWGWKVRPRQWPRMKVALQAFHAASKSKVPFDDLWQELERLLPEAEEP